MRLEVPLWLALLACGCQCFLPVDELLSREDGGARADGGARGDAGTVDAGSDGGPECRLASDCALRVPDGGFGAYGGCGVGAGMSCLAGRCLSECRGGRTCTPDAGARCLDCLASGARKTYCAATPCSPAFSCQLTVAVSSCGAALPAGTSLMMQRQSDCSFLLRVPDGGAVVGSGFELDYAEAFATFPGVDGVCVGRDLFTGAPRMEWSCPNGCAFVELGCD